MSTTRTKKVWTIGGVVAAVTIALGAPIGCAVKAAADNRDQQENIVGTVRCGIRSECGGGGGNSGSWE